MFASGSSKILRFSKMNTTSNSKSRQLKVFNPSSIEMAISWKLYLTQDIFDVPSVQIFGKSAFLEEKNDLESDEVNLKILEEPGRQIEPKGLFDIEPVSLVVPPGKDVKFSISCHPKLASKSLENISVQAIGYVTLMNETDVSQEFVKRLDEYAADCLKVTCLVNIAHIDDRKISEVTEKKIVCDAFSLID